VWCGWSAASCGVRTCFISLRGSMLVNGNVLVPARIDGESGRHGVVRVDHGAEGTGRFTIRRTIRGVGRKRSGIQTNELQAQRGLRCAPKLDSGVLGSTSSAERIGSRK